MLSSHGISSFLYPYPLFLSLSLAHILNISFPAELTFAFARVSTCQANLAIVSYEYFSLTSNCFPTGKKRNSRVKELDTDAYLVLTTCVNSVSSQVLVHALSTW